MEITFDDFTRCCPASVTPDKAIYESISVFFETGKSEAGYIITPEIFAELENGWAEDKESDYKERLRAVTVAYICNRAFEDAIPSLDLVLTATGFGVVSNQNVAPASAERVAKLRQSVRQSALTWLDSMLSALRHIKAWAGSVPQRQFFQTLFWRSEQARPFCGSPCTRDDLVAKLGAITAAEVDLARYISPEQLDVLHKAEACATATTAEDMAISLCRSYVIATLCDSASSVASARRILLSFIEEHPDDFAAYRNSQTYKANHFEPYRNEKDDSCFFFG